LTLSPVRQRRVAPNARALTRADAVTGEWHKLLRKWPKADLAVRDSDVRFQGVERTSG